MTLFFDVKEPVKKALEAIQKDRGLLSKYPKTTGFEDKRITIENLDVLAGWHAFDNHPEWFGITEMDGHTIRAYFREGVFQDYGFIPELLKEFSGILESERPEYMQKINRYRQDKGLVPISFSVN